MLKSLVGLFEKEEREKLESSLQRAKDQQSIDPIDLMDKAFLATLKERYHHDAPKQIRDSRPVYTKVNTHRIYIDPDNIKFTQA